MKMLVPIESIKSKEICQQFFREVDVESRVTAERWVHQDPRERWVSED